MATLMRYDDNGLVEFQRGFAVGMVVELMDKPNSVYSDFFMYCIQSGDSSKAYWEIIRMITVIIRLKEHLSGLQWRRWRGQNVIR